MIIAIFALTVLWAIFFSVSIVGLNWLPRIVTDTAFKIAVTFAGILVMVSIANLFMLGIQ